MIYCSGYKCALRTTCARYVDGQRANDGAHTWIQSCDDETRDGYIKYIM